jgi:creatinine amidohydrolase/Fe(II)-dependent formamide hydrolase-like protein
MLASAPELVEMNKAKVHYREIRPAPVGGTVIRARGRVSSVDHFKEITPYGSIGNPLIATKETGEKIYDCIVDFLCEVVKTEFK